MSLVYTNFHIYVRENPLGQLRMDNPNTQSTFGTRHRTRTNKTKHTTQKYKIVESLCLYYTKRINIIAFNTFFKINDHIPKYENVTYLKFENIYLNYQTLNRYRLLIPIISCNQNRL